MESSLLDLEPMPAGLGAQVLTPVERVFEDAEVAGALRRSLAAHHLLLFRGRMFSPSEQLALGRVFGEPERFGSRHLPGHPFVSRVTNRAGDGHWNDIGRYWHADGTMLRNPTVVSLWHVVRPGRGGDTLFADMHRALAELPPAWRSALEQFRMVARTGAVHPAVRRHPLTGSPALYTSLRMARAFEGLTEAESRAWLDRIGQHLDRPGGHVRHRWQAGDLLVGDNFSVAHCATPNDPAVRRVLHRVTIGSDRSAYLAQAYA
jgi:taurine dioxygenase